MARKESDKEDLIADATALVDRAEYRYPVNADRRFSWTLITVGFRKNKSFSIYFDQDPFYQFDPNGSLRRACENGFLYRSEQSSLARLNRERSETQTTLQRIDLDLLQLEAFRDRLMAHFHEFATALRDQKVTRHRAITELKNIDHETLNFLETVLQKSAPFLSSTINMRT